MKMLSRLFIWGVVSAVAGAVIWDKQSYDATGGALMAGAAGGLLIGVVIGASIHALSVRNRKRKA
jgi:hypothetical protein